MPDSCFKIKVDFLFSYEVQFDRHQVLIQKFLFKWPLWSVVILKIDIKQIVLSQILGQLQLTLSYQNQRGKDKKVTIIILQGDPQSLELLAKFKKFFPIENKIDPKSLVPAQFGDTFSLPLAAYSKHGYLSRIPLLLLWAHAFPPFAMYMYFSGSYRLSVSMDALSIKEAWSKVTIPWKHIQEVKIEMVSNKNRKTGITNSENFVIFDILTKETESFSFILSPLDASKLTPLFIKKGLLPKNINLSEIGFIS